MKLLLRRDQRPAMLGGKPVFTLTIRADLTEEERGAISKYQLSGTQLYASHTMTDPGHGLLGLASRLAYKAMITSLYVSDLLKGKVIECRDVVEMLAIESQIREAALNFKSVLEAALHFGGEEVMEL